MVYADFCGDSKCSKIKKNGEGQSELEHHNVDAKGCHVKCMVRISAMAN